jgi:hypothetical protein
MKKQSQNIKRQLMSLALLAIFVVPVIAQTATTCQISYTSAPPIPWLAPSPFNVIIQGMFNFVHSFNSPRFSGTVTCPAPTPTPTPIPCGGNGDCGGTAEL